MAEKIEPAAARGAGIRIGATVIAGLAVLLLIVAVVRPDMMAAALAMLMPGAGH